MSKTVSQHMTHGAMWMISFKLIERSIGLVSTLLLARLLVPADFGLVAMAMSVVAVLELMGAFSFDVALIQRSNAERVHYDTAWTFSVGFGALCAILLLVLAYPAAHFYREVRLPGVMAVLALGALIEGFTNIGVVQFRKELDFAREFRYQLAKKLISFTITVTLALLFRNYWALVIGSLCGRLGGVTMSYVMSRYRPRFSLGGTRDLLGFSSWLLVNNMLQFFTSRFADFVVGRVQGPRALGLYSVSYEIANLPTTELVAPINRAVFPSYAKMSSSRETLAEGYLQVAGMVALFALPAGFGISAVAEPLVAVGLGEKWLDAAPLIALLAGRGAFTALVTNVGAVCLAMARPKLITLSTLLFLFVLLPALLLGIPAYGVMGAAYAYWMASAVHVPVMFGIVAKLLRLRVREIIAVLYRPILSTAFMYLCVRYFVDRFAPADHRSLEQLPVLLESVVLGAIIYFAVLLLLWFFSGRVVGAEQRLLHSSRSWVAARLQKTVGR
jgi:PST family polysaccharide transporter